MDYNVLHENVVGNEPGNILANQFRQLCRKAHVIPMLHDIITQHVRVINDEARVRLPVGGRFIPKGIGPINANVISEDMTWKVFMNLLIIILDVNEMEFVTSIKTDFGNYNAISSPRVK